MPSTKKMRPKTNPQHIAMTLLEFPRLMTRVGDKRLKHYSVPAERAYVDWIKRFIWFYRKRHSADWNR